MGVQAEGGSGGRGGAPVSSCMHEEQKNGEEPKRWPAQTSTTSKWNRREFSRCFSFSLKVVVTGFVVIIYLLSTDAKLVSGGRDRITNRHFHADVFVYFYIFFLCGQKDILFQHSIIFYTETV